MFASRIFPRFGSRLQADPVYILEMFVMRLTGRPGVLLNNVVIVNIMRTITIHRGNTTANIFLPMDNLTADPHSPPR